jgi:hypothetical protein
MKRQEGLALRVEEHLQKIAQNPGTRDVTHWRTEVDTWLNDMEAVLQHTGKKISVEWQERIQQWRGTLEQ